MNPPPQQYFGRWLLCCSTALSLVCALRSIRAPGIEATAAISANLAHYGLMFSGVTDSHAVPLQTQAPAQTPPPPHTHPLVNHLPSPCLQPRKGLTSLFPLDASIGVEAYVHYINRATPGLRY